MYDVIISIKSCMNLNGVDLMATRSDLLDRTLLFEVIRIKEEQRQTEEDFWRSFEAKRPFVLGAVFDVLAKAMRLMTSNIKIGKLPRIADFSKWGYAIAEAAGFGGDNFMNAYRNNIAKVNDEVIASNPVAEAIVVFLEQNKDWKGHATELLDKLKNKEWIGNHFSYKIYADTKSLY